PVNEAEEALQQVVSVGPSSRNVQEEVEFRRGRNTNHRSVNLNEGPE
ncbi:MAG: hypothetical protein RJA77_26, partial [Pseudomonadota bacterium]